MKDRKSQSKPPSSTPSQELAMSLRQRYGIERTPGEARRILKRSVKIMRNLLERSGTFLPPWSYNAMQVIRLMNSNQYVYEMEGEGGERYLSAWPDGRDWENELGQI